MKKSLGLLILIWAICMIVFSGNTILLRLLSFQAPNTATLIRCGVGLAAARVGTQLYLSGGGKLWANERDQ